MVIYIFYKLQYLGLGIKKRHIIVTVKQKKNEILNSSKGKFEITRFKGLGEISPNEFKNFIGDNIKLDPVIIDTSTTVEELLKFYMGKNTPDRQQFIIDNLKVELDTVES